MSFGYGFALPGAFTALGSRFTPLSLFTQGEQGAWYDPSDLTTLFQDSAGTTPVTAVEQPVGLVLDKSQGAPTKLGPELVDTINTAAEWTPYGTNTVTQDGTEVKITYVDNAFGANTVLTAAKGLSQNLVVGKWYVITGYARVSAGGSVNVMSYNGGSVDTVAATITSTTKVPFSIRWPCASASFASIYTNSMGAGESIWLSDISVKELPGNHAFQATSASRPTLSARYNLLTYTEQFENAAWTKSNATVTANAVANPVNGTVDADLVIASAVPGFHYVRQVPTASAAGYTFSAYVKAGGYNFVEFHVDDSGGQKINVVVNLTNGTATNTVGTSTVTALANGWYYITTQGTTTSAITLAQLNVANNGTGAQFTGNGTGGIYIWGADLRVTNDGVGLPAYQRVTTSTDYATTGFPLYLRFDGVDDSLATNSINFTATDKMTVFAGVRKNSSTAYQSLYEISANVALNDGTFGCFAPDSTGGTYGFNMRGTSGTPASGIYYVPTGYAEPITNVLACSYNIGGAALSTELIPRINGSLAQVGGGGTTAGTGNYGNYPLYIGRRGGTSNQLNGRLYSLIVRGAATDTTTISQTETWVNGKTAAY